MSKGYVHGDERLARYVEDVFALDRELFLEIDQRARRAGLPEIQVSLFDARHLEVLARAVGARRAVEIGTLAGYSGTCILRGLTADGTLDTFELDPRHADVALETFERNGFGARARMHVGPALELLPAIEGSCLFDLVFIDADKENYPAYLDWAAANLRTGGLVVLDNAFAWGHVLDLFRPQPADRDARELASARAIHATNVALGRRLTFIATMLPTEDGLAVGVKIA